MSNVDLTNKIERLQPSEERFGVVLTALSAFIEEIDSSSRYLNVRGELSAKSGTTLQDDIELVAAAYDSLGRVIGTSSCAYSLENFFSLDTFELTISLPISQILKIRLYPKKM